MKQDWTAKAITSVMFERDRQDKKWGKDRNHEVARWLMILGEEYGEACEAGCNVTWPLESCTIESQAPYLQRCEDELRNELVQTAAVAVAIIEYLDRKRAAK